MSNQKMLIGYYRLSLEDGSDGESNSIINQRKLVKDYISHIPELAELPFQEFYDDGYSGSSMEDREYNRFWNWQEMSRCNVLL